MSYVVLARKYRPLRFEDMVGQEHVGRTLSNAIRQDRVHHAYLFAGARGLGKTTTARIFAKGLVCEQGPTPQPCNECEQCVAVNEGRSVDVVEIDGASNNSVDNIRQLREQVHYLPQSARRKVYIIDEVHMLTTSAFNALLKTLEEPPPHVNFIFATTEPQKVLPTILSRVSRLDFRRVSVEELAAHLGSILQREGLSVDEGGLRLIGRAAGGSVRDSLTLLDQVIAFSDDPKAVTEDEARRVLGQADRMAIGALVDAVIDRDPDAVIERFDGLVSAGLDLMVLSMQVLEHLRDLTLAAVCKNDAVLKDATESERTALREQAKKTNAAHVGQLFDRFTRVVDRLPNSRVQRLLLEMGLLELAYLQPLVPMGDLVERLEAFARGGGGAPSSSAAPAAGGRSRAGGGKEGGSAGRRASALEESPAAQPPAAQPPAAQPPAAQPAAPAAAPDPAPSPSVDPAPPASAAPPPTHAATVPSTPAAPAAPVPAPQASPGQSPPSAPGNGQAAEPEFATDLMKGLWNMAKGAVSKDNPTPPPPEAAAAPATPAPTAGGPCNPPPPADGVINLEVLEEFEAFEELVDRIRRSDEYVSAVLSEVGLVGLRDGVLRVAAVPRSFAHIELTSRPEIRAQVEQATRDHFGRPFTLELVEGEAALPEFPSIVLMDAKRRAEHRARVEEEARAHTGIQGVLSQFNATITSVKPLQDPPRK